MRLSSDTQMETAKLEMKMKCSSLEIWEEPSWNQSQNQPRHRPPKRYHHTVAMDHTNNTSAQYRLRRPASYHRRQHLSEFLSAWVNRELMRHRVQVKKQKGKE